LNIQHPTRNVQCPRVGEVCESIDRRPVIRLLLSLGHWILDTGLVKWIAQIGYSVPQKPEHRSEAGLITDFRFMLEKHALVNIMG